MTNKLFIGHFSKELPFIGNSYYLPSPENSERDFLVEITQTKIGQKPCFTVKSMGKHGLLGLLNFFQLFTEEFENGELGNTGETNSLPFVIIFKSGISYALFKEGIKLDGISIRYMPVVPLIENKFFTAYLFL